MSFNDLFKEKSSSPKKAALPSAMKPRPPSSEPPTPKAPAVEPVILQSAVAENKHLNEKQFLEAEKQHRLTQDLVISTNRILIDSVSNLSKVRSDEERERFLGATRDLHDLTAVLAANSKAQLAASREICDAQLAAVREVLLTVSQHQQFVVSMMDKMQSAGGSTGGGRRAPAPSVAPVKGLDNESKSDKTKRLKKEKEEAAAAAMKDDAKKPDDDDDDHHTEKKPTSVAGTKRKATEEKEKAPISKLKGSEPAQKKARAPAATKKASKKASSDSDASSASELESDDDEKPKPKKRPTTPPSTQPTKAAEMDE